MRSFLEIITADNQSFSSVIHGWSTSTNRMALVDIRTVQLLFGIACQIENSIAGKIRGALQKARKKFLFWKYAVKLSRTPTLLGPFRLKNCEPNLRAAVLCDGCTIFWISPHNNTPNKTLLRYSSFTFFCNQFERHHDESFLSVVLAIVAFAHAMSVSDSQH